jgi:phage repressor protein C with HTH and peptisase S24 domain
LDTQQIYELIEARRKELNLSQAQLGQRALGQDNSSVIQAIRRGSSPSAQKLQAICDALGLEFYVGPKRHAEPDKRSNHETIALLDEFAFVERFDVALSGGPGSTNDNARKLAPVAFRREWLTASGLNPSKCVVCSVVGFSMEPLLWEGDLVLLDRRRSDLRSGEVYGVVDVEGDTRVKRLEKIENGLLLRSENSECPTEARLGEDANRVRIIGRLAWSGHGHADGKRTSKRGSAPSTFKHGWF